MMESLDEGMSKSNAGSVLPRFTAKDPPALGQAVVFVYAPWSISARRVLPAFESLANSYPVGESAGVRFLRVNADNVDYDWVEREFGFLPEGYGEVFIVSDGVVVQTFRQWDDETVENIRQFMGGGKEGR